MLLGRATAAGTSRFAARFGSYKQFFRQTQGLTLSTLGIGTYLGSLDDETTRRYTDAVCAAIERGVNVIDTSLNYRHQRSERAIGVALIKLLDRGPVTREELLICSKAGYLVPDAVPDGLDPNEIVGGMHCLTPRFLADQLERSRVNLGLETVDVFYLHNPETQLGAVPLPVWESRMRTAFEQAELFVRQGKIAFYGVATWDAFRKTGGAVSLERLVALAREVAGEAHCFRFVQLPFNLAMPEAVTLRAQQVQGRSLAMVEAAAELGVTLIASASLLQARLSRNLPAEVAPLFPGLDSDALRAIQFSRSAPGITTALTGMSDPAHVAANTAISSVPPLSPDEFLRLFRRPDAVRE